MACSPSIGPIRIVSCLMGLLLVGCTSAAPAPSAVATASARPSAGPPETASVATPEPTPSPSSSAVAEPDPTEASGSATGGPDGCGTGDAGFFAHRREVPKEMHFGGATLEFTTAAIGLRNGTYQADDAIPGGIGLESDEIAVRVDPGTHIILRGTDLTLPQLSARAWAWATVDFSGGLASFRQDAASLEWRLRTDGSISISAPDAPGDYAVELLPIWRSACLQGDGTAYGRIKVNG